MSFSLMENRSKKQILNYQMMEENFLEEQQPLILEKFGKGSTFFRFLSSNSLFLKSIYFETIQVMRYAQKFERMLYVQWERSQKNWSFYDKWSYRWRSYDNH